MCPLNTRQNKSTGTRKELPPIKNGTYVGRIVGVADIGMQKQEDWQTKEEKPPKEEILIFVEFPKLRLDVDGESKPRWLSRKVNVAAKYNPDGSYNDYYENSNMFKLLEPLMDGDEDVGSIVNKPVMCMIGHTKNDNPKIVNINPAPEEMSVAELENKSFVFDFYSPDVDEFQKLPKWVRKNCMEALDYEGSQLEVLVEAAGLDEED